MKVGGSNAASWLLNRIRDRGDSGGGNSHSGQGDQKSGSQKKDESAVSDEEVQAAVQAFGSDEQAAAAGLHVDQIGNGPGLRVVLKDVSGNVVRQFTGSEFVRLRDVTGGRSLHAPGKILDRKL